MPILVQKIVDQMASELDAENSERYLFEQDYKPSINFAIDMGVAIFNEAFAQNKLSPEQLREITKVRVWQANGYSRIAYNETDTGETLWTLIAVYPDPVTNKQISGSLGADKSVSKFQPGISFISSTQAAKRLSLESWNENQQNPFMPGNTMFTVGGLKEYAYLDFANYSSTTYTGNNGLPEITIRPDVSGKLVALAYLKTPNKVNAISDSVEFPPSLLNLIVELALNFISVKQGEAPLIQVSDAMVNRLVSLMK